MPAAITLSEPPFEYDRLVSDLTAGEQGENAPRVFEDAWSHIDAAIEARRELARCWSEFCGGDGFSAQVVALSDSSGRLDVRAAWPPEIARRADAVAEEFASHVKNAFDESLLAAAAVVSGAIQTSDRAVHVLPLCHDEQAFDQLVADGALCGLRPDQVKVARQFQPFDDATEPDALGRLRREMLHLAEMLSRREPDSPRVAAWAHSAAPEFRVHAPGADVVFTVLGDAVLERRLTVATFTCSGVSAHDIQGNPVMAFDLIFNDPPWPSDPNDNLMRRTAYLVAAACEFVRGLERSVGHHVPLAPGPPFAALVPMPDRTPWGQVDLDALDDGPEIAAALARSDLGIGTLVKPDGGRMVLLRLGERTFGRPIPPALPLPVGADPGPASEEAILEAVSLWGLPDFVMKPKVVKKGKASREVGDGTVIVGRRGLAVQAKARQCPTGDADRECRWIDKKVREGASQASGTIRFLSQGKISLVNQRARAVEIDGSTLDWVRVMILDHGDPPELTIDTSDQTGAPLVVLLRRDWDFVFDQLRSTSAVVDYLFRVAGDRVHRLGDEPARYFELAQADAHSAGEPASWTRAFAGAQGFSHPLLPTIPPSQIDQPGHTVFRLIMEDIAESSSDRDESDRLLMLSLLDRFPVTERAGLGRLLLSHLDDVVAIESGTRWQFRRVLLDEGTLQLAFGASTALSFLHREAFRQWAMLRHHEFTRADLPSDPDLRWTVAVILTPRYDGYRPWDTTTFTVQGELGLTAEEIARMRRLWNSDQAA